MSSNITGREYAAIKYAFRRAEDSKRSRGGMTVLQNVTAKQLESKKKNLDILKDLEGQLAEANKTFEACFVRRVFDKAKHELVKKGIFYIENPENGAKIIAANKTPKDMKPLVRAVDSILNGKPNEYARGIFR